ncbi:MAG: nucleotidyltransferase domain-containing protein [Candidatus Pacebacteria bacterium]|nr:nucleotidyltransferase domain-containing protein [Candidatus Paceibacterota bacterium]
MRDIERFCGDLRREFEPRRIILFGSYASGDARTHSDVDLLVEMDHLGSGCRTAAAIIRRLKPRFGLDLIVRSRDEITTRLVQHDSFLTEIVNNGEKGSAQ